MRRTWCGLWLVAALASPAVAAERSAGSNWSVMSGAAVGASHLAFQFQAGWPELSLGGFYGVNDKLDAGVQLGFAYGEDGSIAFGPGVVPGFRIQVAARYNLLDTGTLHLGASFLPGYGIDYLPGLAVSRILLPLSLTLGITPSEAMTFHVGLDLPIYITADTFGGVTLPILVGGGVEYHVDRALSLTAQLRLGPALLVTQAGAPARLALDALVGLAYRI